MEIPVSMILTSGPKRWSTYSTQVRQSLRSLMPKEITLPSLSALARWFTIKADLPRRKQRCTPPERSRSALPR